MKSLITLKILPSSMATSTIMKRTLPGIGRPSNFMRYVNSEDGRTLSFHFHSCNLSQSILSSSNTVRLPDPASYTSCNNPRSTSISKAVLPLSSNWIALQTPSPVGDAGKGSLSRSKLVCNSTMKNSKGHSQRLVDGHFSTFHFARRPFSTLRSGSNPVGIQNGKYGSSQQETKFELVDSDSTSSWLLLHRNGERRKIPSLWLRDHCRCESCYNSRTSQKEAGVINPSKMELEIQDISLQDDYHLVLHWKDNHVSKFSVDWLMDNFYHDKAGSMVKRTLWDGATIKDGKLPSVSFSKHMETEDGLGQTLRNLLQYGFTVVTEAPASLEGTRLASERVAPIQQTLFGGLWEFTANQERSDTAYSTGYLDAHTDNTYLEIPAGIQVFQCLQHDGEGGETLLVDGFHAVETLRETDPEAVRCLAGHVVPHEYKEPREKGKSPGYHMYTLCPVIQLHPATGQVLYIRFNPYDRAPLNTIPSEQMAEFYQSYYQLSETIADPKGQFWVKLKPGNVLFIDNWRVMHGRSGFTGRRVMSGCYLQRDEWLSKARVMGAAYSG